MNRLSMAATLAVIAGLLSVAGWSIAGADGSLLHEASLRNGDYGTGAAVDTMGPDHGAMPGASQVLDSNEGAFFLSSESDSQSNALINFVLSGPARTQFLSTGTVSFMFKAKRSSHVSGAIFGDNYGFTAFHNGQGASGGTASRIANGAGIEDDQVSVNWKTLAGTWQWRDAVTLEYDQWYHIGFAWGGPGANYETWVCGELMNADSRNSLPWGASGLASATNVGLGDNHERGYSSYDSAAGVTFADIRIWYEYRPMGDTRSCHMVFLPAVLNNY
jgi:hypothetical protein